MEVSAKYPHYRLSLAPLSLCRVALAASRCCLAMRLASSVVSTSAVSASAFVSRAHEAQIYQAAAIVTYR
jgi:hypothetical protein